MPVIFITDGLIFFLIVMIIAFGLYARKHEHLCAPWRQVGKNKLAMSASVVLLFYVLTGLLDSLHFYPRLKNDHSTSGEVRYSTEIISVFDLLVNRLRENNERTYSAPFATHAYAKEILEQPGGNIIRGYPRLMYGGAHLERPDQQKNIDIFIKTLTGILIGMIVWLVFSAVILAFLACNRKEHFINVFRDTLNKRSKLPWHIILLTLGVLVLIISTLAYLSNYYHVFGTDKVGQDVLYQSLKSIRTGLLIGTLTTLVMLPFAIAMGIMAGYFRGWVDDAIQYIYTTLSSIPGVLLIAASILMLEVYMANNAESFTSTAHRADMRLLFLCLILGIMSWTGLCRLLRGEALKLREIDYVQAAYAFGVSHTTIIMRHLLPNVMHIVMISIVIDFSGLVLAEAVLAYINIGVDPTMISWGNMINNARLEMAREPVVWWSLSAAFIFMLGLVLSANLFADAVRDAFDPRIREL